MATNPDQVETNPEVRKLYRVRKTLYEMLQDRGYLVTSQELEMTFEGFTEKYGDESLRQDGNLDLLKVRRDGSGERIMVIFPGEGKIGVKMIKKYVDRMKAEQVYRAILVLQQRPTCFATQILHELANSKGRKYPMEVFLEDELLTNITHHQLVPDFKVLTPEEKEMVMKRYGVQESQLPRLQIRDAISRYYGLKRGDVVKVKRVSETAGKYSMGAKDMLELIAYGVQLLPGV